jgi:DNA ligase D-like protein (predicted ligase)
MISLEKIKPMLARVGTPKDLKNGDMIYELKIDGTRCICYKDGNEIRLLNRRGVWFEHRFPEIVLDLIKVVKARRAILDGEVYVPNRKGKPDFSKLAERDHLENKFRINMLSRQMPAVYAVFDVISLEGKDLTGIALNERKNALEEIVDDSNNVKKIFYTENGLQLWKAVKEMKLEGVMAKKKGSPYLEGQRTDDWLKIKVLQTLDLIILGYTTGTGWRVKIGSLITGCYRRGKLIYTGKVGTGLTENGWKGLQQRLEKTRGKYPFEEEVDLELPPGRMPVWVRPKYVCEVRFMKLTKNMQMRAPSFLRLREDKEPKDCKIEDYITRQA